MKTNKFASLIPTMRDNFLTLLTGIQAPSTWYNDWGLVVRRAGRIHRNLTAEQSCCIFAALSPQKSLARNWAMYQTFLTLGGESVHEATRRQRALVDAMAVSRDPLALMSGPKTTAFARNLLGDVEAVTVDSLTAQAAMDDRSIRAVREPLYTAVADAVKQTADMLGWDAPGTQAHIWTVWRELKTVKRFSDSDPRPEDLY